MYFLVLAWDIPGEEGKARRDAARADHAAATRELWERGQVVFGGGMQDYDGVSCGSLIVVDYPSRADVDKYIAEEPLNKGGAWGRIEVHPMRVGSYFLSGAVKPGETPAV